MADENPFVKYSTAQSVESENPFAKYDPQYGVGVVEDIKKTAVPNLVRGTLATLTAPRALSDITGEGVNWLANKFAPQSVANVANRFHNWDTGMGPAFPSYGQLKSEYERDIAPLPNATTGIGKGVQSGMEIFPGMLAGGEGVLPAVGRSVGAAIGSGAIGSALDTAKSYFPKIPDWVPQVGRAAGAFTGGALAPRAATPLPMSGPQLATTNAINAVNPELRAASTAGQWTGSPTMQSIEANSSRAAGVPQAQAEAYTRGVMGQAGAPGQLFNPAGHAQASSIGNDLELMRAGATVNPTEMALLNRTNRTNYGQLADTVGDQAAAPYFNLKEDIRLGPMRGAVPSNTWGHPLHPTTMSGERNAALAQQAQAAGTGATPSLVGEQLFDLRSRLKNALYNSMSPDEAARMQNAERQYSNWKIIEPINTKAGESTITPNQVHARAQNAPGGGALTEHANNAAQVMQPLPPPSGKLSEGVKGTLGTLGGLAAGAVGWHHGGGFPAVEAGGLGALVGHEVIPSLLNMGKNVAGSVAMNPAVQGWAKNQLWRPEAYTNAPNKEALLRALLTSPQTASLPPPGQ